MSVMSITSNQTLQLWRMRQYLLSTATDTSTATSGMGQVLTSLINQRFGALDLTRPSPDQVDQAMNAVATALDLTPAALRERLQWGTTLTEVATTNGMKPADLRTTITSALRNADATLTTYQAGTLADQIIEGPPKPSLDTYMFDLFLNQDDSRSQYVGLNQPTWWGGTSGKQLALLEYSRYLSYSNLFSSAMDLAL